MLVLSRKQGQSILIGERIKVKVIGIHGQQVRIGIEAPPTVPVVRDELHRAVAEANRQASHAGARSVEELAGVFRSLGREREEER
ncbi:MAG: carbon storage regulator [Acidobacteria bacterium]|nr:MAG: carbon storage regulator [Acidobacteriota bacterium]